MEQDLLCEHSIVHNESVAQAKEHMPPEEILFQAAELFKIFGDSTRIRIICALQNCELCVCDIAELLGMTQSAISHQLRLLRNSRIVKTRRDGKSICYSLDDEHVYAIIAQGLHHITEGGADHE